MSRAAWRPPAPDEEAMIARFLPVVGGMVGQMYRRRRLPSHVLREDLVAAGRLGLVQALRRGQRDAAFEHYVRQCIRGALLDELRREDWLSRRGRWEARQGRGFVFVELEQLEREPRVTGEDRWLVGRLRDQLAQAFAALDKREAEVLRARFVDGETCDTLALRLRVSKPRVSQITSGALAKLRAALEGGGSADRLENSR
jgi:RNA polymerase sigma factor (sigma-70 family)